MSMIDHVTAWLSKKIGGSTTLQFLRVTLDPDQIPLETTEVTDTSGTTKSFIEATVGDTGIALDNAGKVITLAVVGNIDDTENVLASWDGGTTFMTIPPGGIVGWPPKGSVTTFDLKAESGKTVSYTATINTVA